MIEAGADRIFANEIEETILESSEVHEAAVIGVPDGILGGRIRAFSALREGSRLELFALEKILKRKLPPYRVPDEILVRDDFPKNESGMIMKQLLRKE